MSENKVVLGVTGMSCGGCVRAVTAALEEIAGEGKVDVSLEENRAEIDYEGDPEELVKAVQAAGYSAETAQS